MPRKTPRSSRPARASAPRFNEAAARCHGKRGGHQRPGRERQTGASMRPRPDATENRFIAGDPDLYTNWLQ